MIPALTYRPTDPPTYRHAGFTLIEIVIVLTILSVLAAATVPSFRGLQKERQARAPIAELERLAKEARQRAMKERRPYQVAITATGFTASRYFDPYLSLAELTTFLATVDAAEQAGVPEEVPVEASAKQPDPASAGNVGQSAPASNGQPQVQKPEWNERYTLPPGMSVSVWLFRANEEGADQGRTPVEGEMVKLWVFQPNGMCEPLSIKITNDSTSLYVRFSALTADIVKETSSYR